MSKLFGDIGESGMVLWRMCSFELAAADFLGRRRLLLGGVIAAMFLLSGLPPASAQTGRDVITNIFGVVERAIQADMARRRQSQVAQPIFDAQSEDTRMEAQRRLQEEGLYSSDIDGVWGPGTAKAFELYARRNDQAQLLQTQDGVVSLLEQLVGSGTQQAGARRSSPGSVQEAGAGSSELDVGEGLASEVYVNRQQGADLVSLLDERVFRQLNTGRLVDIRIGKPQFFNNSFLGDREQQKRLLQSMERFRRSTIESFLDSWLRDCEGLRICRGNNVIVIPFRLDIKSQFLNELQSIFDELGNRAPRIYGDGRDFCGHEKTCINLVMNAVTSSQSTPVPSWRKPIRWRFDTSRLQIGPNGIRAPLIEILDRDGNAIVRELAGSHARSSQRDTYLFAMGDGNLYPLGGSMLWVPRGNEFYIFSGAQFLVVVNLRETDVGDVGKVRVSYDYSK